MNDKKSGTRLSVWLVANVKLPVTMVVLLRLVVSPASFLLTVQSRGDNSPMRDSRIFLHARSCPFALLHFFGWDLQNRNSVHASRVERLIVFMLSHEPLFPPGKV